MEKLEFVEYSNDYYDSFLNLLSEYFDEIFIDKPNENIPKKYLPRIINACNGKALNDIKWTYLCILENKPIGFAIAKIDTKENPMCKREGWGFIMEFYILPDYRRKGYATELGKFIENVIYKNGAENIYLTANPRTGIPFWESMGYIFSGKNDDKNGNRIYEKCGAKGFADESDLSLDPFYSAEQEHLQKSIVDYEEGKSFPVIKDLLELEKMEND